MERKYSIVYADPPWKYDMKKGQGVAENHYQTMSIEEICSLPIGEITQKDAVLFLWVTFPQLPEAFKVMKAWGFAYKTVAFVWVKQNKTGKGFFFGLGYWTRSNAEICLIGVKGHMKRISNKVFQLIVSPLEGHSKKPDEARTRIVELMGDLPRIELFARQEMPGWDVWGNEVTCSPGALDLEKMERKEEPEASGEGVC
ncbi:DNA methyltransferase [Lachnospiraceae bacterium MD308]|nr:DNA methyltransferase [Lachnospiraceae bacterium MD308]